MIENKWEDGRLILMINPASEITISDMKKGVENLLSSPDLPDELCIIENALKSMVMFKVEDIGKVIRWTEEIAKRFSKVKHALITHSPEATALGLLIKDGLTVRNYHLDVFSTEAAARKWIYQ